MIALMSFDVTVDGVRHSAADQQSVVADDGYG